MWQCSNSTDLLIIHDGSVIPVESFLKQKIKKGSCVVTEIFCALLAFTHFLFDACGI